MQAVIFCAFFLLVDLFGLADFVVFLGNGTIHVKQRPCPYYLYKIR
jgi:hypothetical protein